MSQTKKMNPPEEPSPSIIKNLLKPVSDLIAKAQGIKLRESLEDVIENDNELQNAFSPEEKSMIRNILEFSDVNVEDIMVPRADIIAADLDTSLSEICLIFSKAGFSRCPVYNGNLDHPVGMIHFKDVMNWLVETSAKSDTEVNLESVNLSQTLKELDIVRDVLFVPPSMLAADLLLKMQKQRIHMALVIDEYGGTDGLVTIENLVEEIVGEIEDEHDDDVEVPSLLKVSEQVYEADARLLIEELEEKTGLDFLSDDQDEDVDTLGGLVFSLAGHIPIRGELVEHASGTQFEILEADSRRIKRLKIKLGQKKVLEEKE